MRLYAKVYFADYLDKTLFLKQYLTEDHDYDDIFNISEQKEKHSSYSMVFVLS